MTCPTPSGNVMGCPRSQDASNCSFVDHATPTYCTVRVAPAWASAPVPTVRSWIWRVVGGGPSGIVTSGFVPTGLGPTKGGDVVTAGGGLPLTSSDVFPPSEPPQAAASTTRTSPREVGRARCTRPMLAVDLGMAGSTGAGWLSTTGTRAAGSHRP